MSKLEKTARMEQKLIRMEKGKQGRKKKNRKTNGSGFYGHLFERVGTEFLIFFGSILTLGIAYPWLKCNKVRWIARNTNVDGQYYIFTGTGWKLFLKGIGWFFATILTLGIYYFWYKMRKFDWYMSNIHAVNYNPYTKTENLQAGLEIS